MGVCLDARCVVVFELSFSPRPSTAASPARAGQLGGYGKRFQFLHRPLSGARKSFVTVTLSTTGEDDVWPRWEGVRIDAEFVRANERVPAPRGVCGPVVGEVTTSSAVVLLEIDRDGAVRCTLRDSFDGSRFEQVQSLRGGVAQAFKFEGLYPQRR